MKDKKPVKKQPTVAQLQRLLKAAEKTANTWQQYTHDTNRKLTTAKAEAKKWEKEYRTIKDGVATYLACAERIDREQRDKMLGDIFREPSEYFEWGLPGLSGNYADISVSKL